jgi:molybdate-binding protein/DNA-binding XRE family transcriptional regulator
LKTRVKNRLAEIREARGVSVSALAREVGVSRGTIYAIEAGTYIPNTEIALHLAQELEVTVEELFSLQAESATSPGDLAADLLGATPPAKNQPVRICQVGPRWVAVPVSASPYYLPEADAIVTRAPRSTRRVDLAVFAREGPPDRKRLVLAGCDPATSLLSRMVEKESGVEIVSAAASSKLAITWLEEGKVHIAGTHLEDPKTGEFNLPFIRQQFPDGDFRVVTFARWEEGLVVAAGNPKGIRQIEDLARKNVTFVNREPGSGSRGLLDERLHKAGIGARQVHGYDRVAFGHLAAAYCLVSGEADVCLATQSAARTFGLDFIPLRGERYDLVMRKHTADLPAVQAFLDVLQRGSLRRKLEVLAGYDTSDTGSLVG